MAALRKYDKISMQIPFYREFHVFKEASSKLKEELELVSATFFAGFFDRNYEIFKNHFDKIFWNRRKLTLPDCVCFLSYSLKDISCFMLRYLTTSQTLRFWNSKIWISQERIGSLMKWNQRHVFLVSKVFSFRLKTHLQKYIGHNQSVFKYFE